MTPAGCQGARSLTNLTPYACSCSQTPSQRIFKSFKPRISIAWIIKPKKQLVTAFPNTKAIYFSLPTTLCSLCLSFAHPNISNFLYEYGNKEEITSKNRVTQIALTCGSGVAQALTAGVLSSEVSTLNLQEDLFPQLRSVSETEHERESQGPGRRSQLHTKVPYSPQQPPYSG